MPFGCGSFWLMKAKCWKKMSTIKPTVLAMKMGIQIKKMKFDRTHSVDHAKNSPMSLILLLNRRMKATMKAATSNITIATIILSTYFPSKPLGESTKNNTPMEMETKTDKKIAMADMA